MVGPQVDPSTETSSLTKYVDKASPKLMEACATGKHISKAKIEMCRAGGSQLPYMVVNLEEIIISTVQHGSDSGKDFPTEGCPSTTERSNGPTPSKSARTAPAVET